MKSDKKTIIILLLASIMAIISACSRADSQVDPSGIDQEQDRPPSPPTEWVTSPAKAPLPPPVVVTISAEDFVLPESSILDTLEAEAVVQAPAALPYDIQLLIDEIQRGVYAFEQPAAATSGIQATYTYSDIDRDGLEDLVIIVVAEEGGFTSVSAGSFQDGPEIHLAPLPGSDDGLQTLSIPAETLAELAVANGIDQEGAIILTLSGAQTE